jgi:Tfp pilus assembly protein PilV
VLRGRAVERTDSGESLIEILVALTILAVCLIAIASGIVLSIKISVVHRNQATAQDYLHNYAETLEGTTYKACTASTPTTYPSVATAVGTPAGFTAPTVAVNYWVAATASFTANQACPGAGDSGLQQVTFKLLSSDNLVSESLVVTIRSSS